ncbi:MAG TPA: biotin--[acetyl-CoA-carboxylase] ligase [Vulgatibacter sp.]|nr:biotin--[acetyl-CoA-carboxylase] ligase [Vulgatibacter sp.]
MHDRGASAADLVLGFLTEAEGEGIAADVLGGKLDLRPAEVYHAIEVLRRRGYEIESQARTGYRLVSTPDRLEPAEITARLATRELGWAIHHHAQLPSTSDEAMRLAKGGAAHGEVVTAEKQTAGRGRRGRSWASPARVNLYLSVILRPDLPPQRAPELAFVVAVATAEALREFSVDAGIKWPNDLVVGDRKIAGILLDLAADAGRIHFIVAGIGIDVNATLEDFPEGVRDLATSMRLELGYTVSRAAIAAALLGRLEAWLDRFEAEGFEPVRARYRELSSILGHPVRLSEADEVLEGVAEEIDEGGALLVRDEGGAVHRFVSGDVVSLRLSE